MTTTKVSPVPESVKSDKRSYWFFLVGLALALLSWGLQLIGTTVNVWLGGVVLTIAFALMAYAFWIWERTARWHRLLRLGTIIVMAVLYLLFTGKQIVKEWSSGHPSAQVKPPSALARVRVLDVIAVPMSRSGAPFPGINIFYDNAGTGTATGIVSRFAAGFGGALSDKDVIAAQDELLHWEGWKSAMNRRRQYEMHPGDPGEFTTIPNMEGPLAEEFRTSFGKVAEGKTVLHVFITFKYFDPSGAIGVTEDCFWFSGGFARHNCGRGRTFLEQ